MQEDKKNSERMWQLFEEHWSSKPHVCEACGEKIYGENKSLYHDHLLAKSKYPEYKYDIENLFLCCWQCHSNKENGHPHLCHQMAVDAVKEKHGI